eukprot:366431-Chlamydomonas_euryale.AAC.7
MSPDVQTGQTTSQECQIGSYGGCGPKWEQRGNFRAFHTNGGVAVARPCGPSCSPGLMFSGAGPISTASCYLPPPATM